MTIPTLSYRGKGGVHVDLDALIRSRMLIQANSGGGKSWALRQLLEETFGKVQHLVIDPEGEYHTLREEFDYVLAAKHGADAEASPRTAKMLCRRLMETSASAVIDLYDLPIAGRREFVKLFLTELMALPKDLRRSLLVVLDEAHVFAPEGAKSDALEAVMTLASQGRKRGYALVCATQRLSKLSKDVAAEMLTRLIGRTGLDLDVKRAGDELGMDKERRGTLPTLEPGQFYAFGPALPPGPPRLVRTGDIRTSHPQPGAIEAPTPPPSAKVKALLDKAFADLPKQAAEEARNVAELQRTVTTLKTQLTKAQKSAPAAEPRIVERTVVDERAIQRAVNTALKPHQDYESRVLIQVGRATKGLRTVVDSLEAITSIERPNGVHPIPAATPIAAPRPTRIVERAQPQRVVSDTGGVGTLTGAKRRIVRALAELEAIGVEKATRAQLGFYVGMTFSGGYGSNTLGTMRTEGLVDYPEEGYVALTDDGRGAAGDVDPPVDLDDLHARVRRHLSGLQERVFDAVIALGKGGSMTRDELGEMTGATYSGGYGSNTLGALRTAGIIRYPTDGSVGPSDLLFPEGW